MSRLLKIAGREYAAYVRTVGFWLSMCLMPAGVLVLTGAPALVARTAPVPKVAVIDMVGGYASPVAANLSRMPVGRTRPTALVLPPIDAPVTLVEARRTASARVSGAPGGMDAVVLIHGLPADPNVDLWSRKLADPLLQAAVAEAVGDHMRQSRLIAAGMSPMQIQALEQLKPRLAPFSPRAGSGGAVGLRDRLPGLMGFVMAMLLWAMVFTGAGILLNSVIEEKASRILEVLLSSASVFEIMAGKILGVAAVTATVLLVWLSFGAVAGLSASPAFVGELVQVLIGRGLIVYFAVYLIGGYLMYASLFVAIGAFCETTREAQTLLAPLMLVLTTPIMFMSQAIQSPDSPLLATLSWVPLFTPFLMPARIAAQPPIWEIAGTAALMLGTTAVIVWGAGAAFRAGALSTGKPNLRLILGRFVGGRA